MAPALDLTLTTSSGKQAKDRFALTTQRTTIGRSLESAIRITHPCISRKHATIELRHGHVYVHDHSSNGTWLNGERLLRDGPGICLRYDDVRVCLPCALLHPCDCMLPTSHVCALAGA